MKQIKCLNCSNLIEFDERIALEVKCHKCTKVFRLVAKNVQSGVQSRVQSGKEIPIDSKPSSPTPPKSMAESSLSNFNFESEKSNSRGYESQPRFVRNQERQEASEQIGSRQRQPVVELLDEQDYRQDDRSDNYHISADLAEEVNRPNPRQNSQKIRNNKNNEKRRDRSKSDSQNKEDDRFDSTDEDREYSNRNRNSDRNVKGKIGEMAGIISNFFSKESGSLLKNSLRIHLVASWALIGSFTLFVIILSTMFFFFLIGSPGSDLLSGMAMISLLGSFLVSFLCNFIFYILRILGFSMSYRELEVTPKAKTQLLVSAGLSLLNFVLLFIVLSFPNSGEGNVFPQNIHSFLIKFFPLEAMSCFIPSFFEGLTTTGIQFSLIYAIEVAAMFFYIQYFIIVNNTVINAHVHKRFSQLNWLWLYTTLGAAVVGLVCYLIWKLILEPMEINIPLKLLVSFFFLMWTAPLILYCIQIGLLSLSIQQMIRAFSSEGFVLQRESNIYSKRSRKKSPRRYSDESEDENESKDDNGNDSEDTDHNQDWDWMEDRQDNRKRIRKKQSRENRD